MSNDNFDEIVVKYKKLINAISYKFIKDQHEVENIAQETFLSFFKNYEKYKNEDVKNILCKIALNECKDYLKKKVEHESIDEMYDLEKDENSFEDIEKAEDRGALTQCINSLSSTYKNSITKYYLEEKSLDEVASEMNVSKEVLKVQLTRGKKKLKELLVERGFQYD